MSRIHRVELLEKVQAGRPAAVRDFSALSDAELVGLCVQAGLIHQAEADRFLCRGDGAALYRLDTTARA